MITQDNQDNQDEKDMSLMAFDQYMRFVRWTPSLTEEEEGQLLECVERGRGEQGKLSPDRQVLQEAIQARDRLVEGYQGLVVRIANTYKRCFRSMELLDLIQEGNLGLLKTIERYRVHEGGALFALAVHWIWGAILSAYSERDGMVRMAHRTFVQVQKMRQVRSRLMTTLDRDPTLEEIAAAMEIGRGKVHELIVYERQSSVESLQGLLLECTDESDYGFVSVFEASEDRDTQRQQEMQQAVHQAVGSVLTARQQEAIRLRFGLSEHDGCCHTLVETAQQMGLKWRESLEILQHRAIARLREELALLYESADEQEVA